jgi:hypothetical protein
MGHRRARLTNTWLTDFSEVIRNALPGQSRIRILNAIRKKLAPTLSRPDLEMAVLDYFERLGHDNHRRLCRVYGWEEKKTKASWGGSTVDYKTIAEKAVREMNMQEAQRFLVVCSLVCDLYCPGFNAHQSLAKDSSLARKAAGYKVDTARVSATIREELSKPVKGASLQKNKTTKPKSE